MKRRKHQRVIQSDTIVRNSTDKFPDFIQGRWTQPNSNKVIFEYKYTGWDKTIDWLNKFPKDWAWEAERLWATDVVKFAMVANAAAVGDILMNGLAEKTFTSKVIIPLMESNWFKLGHILSKTMYAVFIEILPVVSVVTALGTTAYIEDRVQQGLLQYCENYARATKTAKDTVDNTWGWHIDSYSPRREHRVHKYKSATITMTADYGKDIIHLVSSIGKPKVGGNDTYTVIQHPQEIGTKGDLWTGLRNVTVPKIQYEKNPEWDHD